MFAVGSAEPLLRPQIVEADGIALRQRMLFVEDQIEILSEQRPTIQPVPVAIEFGSNAEFGFAFLQVFAHFLAAAAQEAEFQAIELASYLLKMRNQKG